MLPDNILHINETDHVQELVEYYSMADVFLQLSLEETFGKVTAEALACGTPVITVDSTANAELIGDGCGIVLQGNDPAKVAEAIGIIRKTGKEFYQNACREFARKNFNVQERVEEQIELYNQLLK